MYGTVLYGHGHSYGHDYGHGICNRNSVWYVTVHDVKGGMLSHVIIFCHILRHAMLCWRLQWKRLEPNGEALDLRHVAPQLVLRRACRVGVEKGAVGQGMGTREGSGVCGGVGGCRDTWGCSGGLRSPRLCSQGLCRFIEVWEG